MNKSGGGVRNKRLISSIVLPLNVAEDTFVELVDHWPYFPANIGTT
jgi:hypothetical protein